MKHVTVADKHLLLGDETTDLLVDYATAIGQENTADNIELRAIGPDGNEVTATFLLNSGLTIIAESTASGLPEPDNRKADEYIRSALLRIARTHDSDPRDVSGASSFNAPDQD